MPLHENATRSMMLLTLREAIDEAWSMIDDPDPTIRELARELFRDSVATYREVAK